MTHLKTEEQYKFGQVNIIPFAGEVKISKQGIIEVEDDIAQAIVDTDCGFSFLEKGHTKDLQEEGDDLHKLDQEDLSKKEQDDFNEEQGGDLLEKASVDATHPSLEQIEAELEKSTLAELKELAKPFEASEWRALSKSALVQYLALKTV